MYKYYSEFSRVSCDTYLSDSSPNFFSFNIILHTRNCSQVTFLFEIYFVLLQFTMRYWLGRGKMGNWSMQHILNNKLYPKHFIHMKRGDCRRWRGYIHYSGSSVDFHAWLCEYTGTTSIWSATVIPMSFWFTIFT